MKIAAVKAHSGVLHTVGVGGPCWKLRERVSCSNREMFYAEAAVTAERMK